MLRPDPTPEQRRFRLILLFIGVAIVSASLGAIFAVTTDAAAYINRHF